MIGMVLALTAAGIVQVYLERIAGRPFMEVQTYLGFFYSIRFWGGIVMTLGLVFLLLDMVKLKPLASSRPVWPPNDPSQART